jgi:hypothetical protein
MITITKSATADTRTCDWSKVEKYDLLEASKQHIKDVGRALDFFCEHLEDSAALHDHDKLSAINHFHSDFRTGFAQHDWWDNHRKISRHHIDKPDGVPEDVNMIDVMEHIADCVMAGMARSGKVTPLALSDEVLQQAFNNTVELLKASVRVEAAQ